MERRPLHVARANRTNSNKNDLVALRHIEPSHCVASSGFQSVRWAAEDGVGAFCESLARRLEYRVGQGLRRGAGGIPLWVPRNRRALAGTALMVKIRSAA